MLNRLRLFSHANSLIRTSKDRYFSQLSNQGVIMHSCCAKCGKEVCTFFFRDYMRMFDVESYHRWAIVVFKVLLELCGAISVRGGFITVMCDCIASHSGICFAGVIPIDALAFVPSVKSR